MHEIPFINRLNLMFRIPSAFLKNIKIIDDFCIYGDVDDSSAIIDVGCANYPQVGLYFANQNYRVYLVDPTLKHKSALVEIENKYSNIKYIPSAIGTIDSQMEFFESSTKISGSLLTSHANAKLGSSGYLVEVLSISTLLKNINESSIGYLKLDLEGAEFDLIRNSTNEMWSCINQVYLEFHHHCTEYKYSDTIDCVKKLEGFGFSVFKLHPDVFLFYRK